MTFVQNKRKRNQRISQRNGAWENTTGSARKTETSRRATASRTSTASIKSTWSICGSRANRSSPSLSILTMGYAGGNFKRPRYQALIRDIESGKINCIIFKDNSRLGRNYPELGRLMEDYFPQKGVRVISVLNNLDSVKDPRGYCSAIVSFPTSSTTITSANFPSRSSAR